VSATSTACLFLNGPLQEFLPGTRGHRQVVDSVLCWIVYRASLTWCRPAVLCCVLLPVGFWVGTASVPPLLVPETESPNSKRQREWQQYQQPQHLHSPCLAIVRRLLTTSGISFVLHTCRFVHHLSCIQM
jgi:hypothetical protein